MKILKPGPQELNGKFIWVCADGRVMNKVSEFDDGHLVNSAALCQRQVQRAEVLLNNLHEHRCFDFFWDEQGGSAFRYSSYPCGACDSILVITGQLIRWEGALALLSEEVCRREALSARSRRRAS